MNLSETKKAIFLTDIEPGLEPLLQQETKIPLENMLMIQSYGPVISHPYGDIMRSIIMTIYQENVEEIFVVGTEDRKNGSDTIKSLLESKEEPLKEQLKTVDYLFKHCMPEFYDDGLKAWLEESENRVESIQKSVDLIRQHPFVPSNVKVYGLMVNHKKEFSIVNQ